MASSKQFWLYTVSLIFFTSHVYAGCSNATLKGSYSYQGVLKFQGQQCQYSGTWLVDGKGLGLDEMKSSNCPELERRFYNNVFRYKLSSSCWGDSSLTSNSNDFQVMPDGTIKLFQYAQDQAFARFSHSLSSDEIKTIQQGQVNWANNGKPYKDLPIYQKTWQQLQAEWHALTFKALDKCPSKKLQGNYEYQGKFTVGDKLCQGKGYWLLDDNGAGRIKGKTQCPDQKEITVNQPLRYVFDDLCQAWLQVPDGSKDGTMLEFINDDKLSKLTYTTQAQATGTFNHTLTESENSAIQQNLTDEGSPDDEDKWHRILDIEDESQDSENSQEQEVKLHLALTEAKANTVAGASWDDLITAGIKAGEAGDYSKAEKQLEAANALISVSEYLSYIGNFHIEQNHFQQAENFYQQCLDTLKTNNSEALSLVNITDEDLIAEYKNIEVEYKDRLVDCLKNLAEVRSIKNRYDSSTEILYKKALALSISHNDYSHSHITPGEILESYVDSELRRHNYNKAESLQRELLVNRQKTLPENHGDIAISFEKIGDINYKQGLYAKAEKNFKNAVSIWQKNGEILPSVLFKLPEIYCEQERCAEAEKLLQQALITQLKLNDYSHSTVSIMGDIGELFWKQGKYPQAEKVIRQALNVESKLKRRSFRRFLGLQKFLADTLSAQGLYHDAEALYLQRLSLIIKNKYDDSELHSKIYNDLGYFYLEHEQYGRAESFLKKAMSTQYQDDKARVIQDLGNLYVDIGWYEKAEQLLQRSISIRETAVPKIYMDQHLDILKNISHLASLYELQAENSSDMSIKKSLLSNAEKLRKQIIKELENDSLNNNKKWIHSQALSRLANCYRLQKKHEDAIPLYEKSLSLAIQLKTKPYHHVINRIQRQLANIYRDQGDYTKAETLYQEVLTKEQAHYPNSQDTADTLSDLAVLQEKKGDTVNAFNFARQSIAIIYTKMQALSENTNVSDSKPRQSVDIFNKRRNIARLLFRLQQKLMANPKTSQLTNLPEAFQTLQLAHGDQRTQSLQQTALRLSSRNPDIQKKVQALWNQQTLWQDLDKRYIEMLSKPGQESVAIAKELQIKQQAAEQEIDKLDKALQQEFPAYAQLIHPEPITLEKAQSLLKHDEALLAYLVDEEASYVFVVRPGQAPVLHRLNAKHQSISNNVDNLHESLKNPQNGLKPFDIRAAYGLYTNIFEPIEKELTDVKHIIVVTDDALQKLPLHLLVKTKPPATPDPAKEHGDYAHADWLAKHYAFSYLPAVHSLAYLRGNHNLQQGSHAKAPFIGFGNPILKEGQVAQTSQPSEQFQSLGQYVALGGDASETLRENLDNLPQTAIALKDIAEKLGVTTEPPKALFLEQEATESQVKQLSDEGRLRQHRIVGFATHALLPPVGEPGLVMTLPAKSGDKSIDEASLLTPALETGGKDDGYLTGSEAATLDLDADWVLLAACETAAMQDSPEGLSQLSKGFFVAGARSVLASQWKVDANTMQNLTRHLFKDLRDHPTLSRAEALQHSMQELINRETRCNWKCKLGLEGKYIPSHPAYWAPFVILGEGGAIPVATE
ncbi:CHAT domain-containing protein [Crenothrix polyspora]|uniref:CHAT domain-containing protein n=1 Tax=Crenothrix polyspora TaxID=360316 RepID=A0A1R4HEN1_9GAMM|nr:CHAT domain-containing protein [Crenothrix polyspora]SJM94491.1 exported hypothetical protein [Crenothrix polyspora]